MKRSASNLGDNVRPNVPFSTQSANKSNDSEPQLRLITGTVENVMHWRKIFPQLVALWEVYGKHENKTNFTPILYLFCSAIVLRIQNGAGANEKLLLLRKGDTGPVMQGFFFEIDFQLPDDVVAGTKNQLIRAIYM